MLHGFRNYENLIVLSGVAVCWTSLRYLGVGMIAFSLGKGRGNALMRI